MNVTYRVYTESLCLEVQIFVWEFDGLQGSLPCGWRPGSATVDEAPINDVLSHMGLTQEFLTFPKQKKLTRGQMTNSGKALWAHVAAVTNKNKWLGFLACLLLGKGEGADQLVPVSYMGEGGGMSRSQAREVA